jgi:hypothetical protein
MITTTKSLTEISVIHKKNISLISFLSIYSIAIMVPTNEIGILTKKKATEKVPHKPKDVV